MRIQYLLLLSIVLWGCTQKHQPSEGAIPKDTFIQLYIDLLIAGEMGYLSSNDSTSKKVIDSLYTRYGVTDAQVRMTMEEYNKDLRRWKDFYDEVTRRLEEKQKEEQNTKGI